MNKIVVLLLAAVSIAACSKSEEPSIAHSAQSAPVATQVVPANNSTGDMLLGGTVGYMLGSSRAQNNTTQTHVIEHRTIVERPATPAPKVAPVAPKPAYKPAPTYRAVTPSRSYSYRPSFSGGRR